jgi:hypothetical protein
MKTQLCRKGGHGQEEEEEEEEEKANKKKRTRIAHLLRNILLIYSAPLNTTEVC